MIAVIQRVSWAKVEIEAATKGKIDKGFMILLGISQDDTLTDVEWISQKILGMRIFADSENKMNLDIKDVGGDILLISQFTLHALTKKGNRPSFIDAAKPEQAIPLYEATILALNASMSKPIQTGVFGADMQVSICNDGPVTIYIDSKNKK